MIRTPGHRYSDADVKRLQKAAARTSGETVKAAALDMGIPPRAAYDLLFRRRKGESVSRQWFASEIKGMLADAKAGKSWGEIAEDYGSTATRVQQVTRSHMPEGWTYKLSCDECGKVEGREPGPGRPKTCSDECFRLRRNRVERERYAKERLPKPKPAPWSDEDRAILRGLLEAGLSQREAAAEMGRKFGAVRAQVTNHIGPVFVEVICEECGTTFPRPGAQAPKTCGTACRKVRERRRKRARIAKWRANATPEELEQARLDSVEANRKSRAKRLAQNNRSTK
jgi:hypothetical protein